MQFNPTAATAVGPGGGGGGGGAVPAPVGVPPFRAFRRFPTLHDDIIHDLSYDFYGKRIATCSSDRRIKVWDMDSGGGAGGGGGGAGGGGQQQCNWVCSAQWKAHAGSIWRIKWAHPEFGQILASCSFDRTVMIWEETEGSEDTKKWIKKAILFEAQRPVQDIKFAPRHLGLKIAAASQDGTVRIYEAIDVTNLSQWSVMEQIEPQKEMIHSVSWNPNPFENAMIAIGSGKEVKIYEFPESIRRWSLLEVLRGHEGTVYDVSWAPSLGRSYHLIATASKDKTVIIWKLTPANPSKTSFTGEKAAILTDNQNEVWRVEWNSTGTILASSGDDGMLRFWKGNFEGKWQKLLVITGL